MIENMIKAHWKPFAFDELLFYNENLILKYNCLDDYSSFETIQDGYALTISKLYMSGYDYVLLVFFLL